MTHPGVLVAGIGDGALPLPTRGEIEEHRAALASRPPYEPAPRAPLAPCDDPVDLRIADEIDYLGRTLASVTSMLAVDPSLRARYGSAVRQLGKMGQNLDALATLLRVNDRAEAVDRLHLPELRGRLQRRAL